MYAGIALCLCTANPVSKKQRSQRMVGAKHRAGGPWISMDLQITLRSRAWPYFGDFGTYVYV